MSDRQKTDTRYLTTAEQFQALKKLAHKITHEEIVQRGLDALEATGLPLEDVDKLARSVGLDLEDVVLSLGSSHGIRRVYHPVQLESDAVRLIVELHEVLVKRQASRLASLSDLERDLFDAADEQVPFSGRELCLRSKHDLNANSKQCLSNLVKLGLLMLAGGRQGYLRTPVWS